MCKFYYIINIYCFKLSIISLPLTVSNMEMCKICNEEYGVLTKIRTYEGMIENVICKSCAYHLHGVVIH